MKESEIDVEIATVALLVQIRRLAGLLKSATKRGGFYVKKMFDKWKKLTVNVKLGNDENDYKQSLEDQLELERKKRKKCEDEVMKEKRKSKRLDRECKNMVKKLLRKSCLRKKHVRKPFPNNTNLS